MYPAEFTSRQICRKALSGILILLANCSAGGDTARHATAENYKTRPVTAGALSTAIDPSCRWKMTSQIPPPLFHASPRFRHGFRLSLGHGSTFF
jgi:hypothetical protein